MLTREVADDVQAIEILNEPNNFGFRDIYGGQRITRLLAGMRPASPAKRAWIESDLAANQDGLGQRCHTFSSLDEQGTVVAFWEAKPWDPNATTANAVITLPLAHEPRHVFLYDLLSGKQIEIPRKRLEDNRISMTVSISGVPKLVIARS
jgi:hypothetical protein